MNKKIFIDVGCNIGYYTSIWMQDENNFIYAFEPEPNLYISLVEKFKEANNVQVLNYAVSLTDGEDSFFVHKNLCNSSLKPSLKNNDDISDTILVKTIRLDTFLNELGIEEIELLKTDAQGSDLDVIKSAGDKIFSVKEVMAEAFLNDTEDVYEQQVRENELIEYMESKNFKMKYKSIDGNYADFVFENNALK